MSEAIRDPGSYRLRDGLVVVEQVQRGKPYFVVKHPETGRVYGLSRASYDLMNELGAGRPVAEVVARASAKGGDRAVEKVAEFVFRMRESGILEGGAPVAVAPPTRGRRILEKIRRFNPLYIKLGTIDPTRLLARLERLFYPIFTRPALAVLGVALAVAGTLVAVHPLRFWNSFYVFRSFHWWAVAYVLLTVSAVVHELGHAMACRKYGGQVRDMGFLIYVLQPGMYTNVTDAWLFPRQRDRVIVSLAGVYMEAFAVAAGIIVWGLSAPFSTANQIGFVVAIVLLTRIVMNLFPLLRLDGYFVLTDVLAVRNLRPRAFAFMLALIPRLGRPWRTVDPIPRRERIILAIYGTLAAATLACVLPLALHGIHLRLVHSSPGHGDLTFLALLCGLVPMIVLSFKRTIDKLRTQRHRAEVGP
jgi:Zn-dependent protease